jgi:hypothetical protein
MSILGLDDVTPMSLKFPGWWDVHRQAMKSQDAAPDPFCPICREIIGPDAQDRLQAEELKRLKGER